MTAITYKAILLEDLFAFCCELNREHCDLPAVIAPPYFDAQSPSKDLVAKADADDANTILLQQFFCEIDKLQDPWVVVEGVVFCTFLSNSNHATRLL